MTSTTTATITVTLVADTFLARGPRLITATRTRGTTTTATITMKGTSARIAIVRIIPRPRTSTTTVNGWDTRVGATTRASGSTTHGSMAASMAALAVDTSGVWREAIPAVSGFAASTSASPRLTLPTVMTGTGTATMSPFTKPP